MDVVSLVSSVVAFVTSHGELVLAVLGVFSAISRVTPSSADNAVVDFLIGVVHKLGLAPERREPPQE